MTEYVCMQDGDFYDAMESRLMMMTFWAHKEVLFEKIKQRIEKEEGAKLEKIAELLVEASKNKWKADTEAEKQDEQFRNSLKDAFRE